MAKWKTVVFTDLPDEKAKAYKGGSSKVRIVLQWINSWCTNESYDKSLLFLFTPIQDNVNSLKKRFETSNMKDDEAYVIM